MVAAQVVDPNLIDVLWNPCLDIEPPKKVRTELLAKFPIACNDVDANENDSVELPGVTPTVIDTILDVPTCCSTQQVTALSEVHLVLSAKVYPRRAEADESRPLIPPPTIKIPWG